MLPFNYYGGILEVGGFVCEDILVRIFFAFVYSTCLSSSTVVF